MMKVITILLLLFAHTNSFAQQRTKNDDSCIVRMKSVTFSKEKNGKIRILKESVPDVIKRIKYCSANYKYPDFYQDRSFELTVPKYLRKLSYGYGDNTFYYSFNDSNDADSLTTSIVVYYDFDNSYKNFFLSQINSKKQDVEIKLFTSEKMYLFKNWQNLFCGKLFLSGNTFIFYCAANQEKVRELQEAILTFKWR